MPTKKKGGDFYGQGTYGCTFSPPPVCTEPETKIAELPRRNKDILAKVFARESDLNEEWKYAEKVARVDPKQEFLLFAASRCKTTVRKVRADKSAAACSFVKNARKSETPLYMAKMKLGGMTLEDYVIKNPVSLDVFVPIVLPVLEGIRKLITHKLVHHDLKFDNVLYNPADGSTKIIDFGMMIPLARVYSYHNPYLDSKYWLHPPEYRIAQFIYDHSQVYAPTKEQSLSMITEVIDTLNIFFDDTTRVTLQQTILDEAFQNQRDYVNAFQSYVQTIFAKQRYGADALDFMSKYSNKVDIYCFGITLTYLSTYIKFRSTAERKRFMEIIKKCVHPDPRKRPGPMKLRTMLMSAIE